MSAIVTVTCEHITNILQHLKFFIPRGDTAINTNIVVRNNKLYMACKSYMLYEAYLGSVQGDDIVRSVRYHDLLPFIKNDKELTFIFDEQSVTVKTKTCQARLSLTYDFTDINIDLGALDDYNQVATPDVFGSLRSFMRASAIFNIYKKEHPYYIYENIVVLKTASIWMQGRCAGIELNAVLTPDVMRALVTLQPEAYKVTDRNLYVVSEYYKCILPISKVVEQNSFSTLLQDLSEPVTINTGMIADTLNAIVAMKPQFVSLSIGEQGFIVRASAAEYDVSDAFGMCEDPKFNCRVPAEILSLCFKMIGNNTAAQLLYKEGVLCIRSQVLIIVLRVMQ